MNDLRHFYINGEILNKKDVVKNQVRGKLGARTFGVASLINKVVSDQQFCEKMAQQVAAGAPEEMKAKAGVHVDAEVSIARESFFVVKVTLKRINIVDYLVKQKKLDESGKKVVMLKQILQLAGESSKDWLENRFTEFVCSKLTQKIGDQMKTNLMRRAGVDVDVQGVSPSKQADHLFGYLRQLEVNQGKDTAPPTISTAHHIKFHESSYAVRC